MSGGTCFSSSAAAPLPDAAIDSPVSDGDAEKAAPVVEQLNGTLTRKFARGKGLSLNDWLGHSLSTGWVTLSL